MIDEKVIRKKTALVLGAGASIPYGFPSGKELRDEIILRLHNGSSRKSLSESTGTPEAEIEEFHTRLRFSGQVSIDAFLERSPRFVDLGKLLVADVLLPLEKTSRLFVPFETPLHKSTQQPRGGDWYTYLFGRMTEDAEFESFGANELSIITLNYDRSLETYLLTALQNSYDRPRGEALDQLRQIPLVHVYGGLGGAVQEEWTFFPRDEVHSLFGTAASSLDALRTAAQGINILSEGTNETTPLREAKSALADAHTIIVLGFGFNKINLERLGLDREPRTRFNFATAKGLEERELNSVKQLLGAQHWRFGDQDTDSLTLLRRHIGWQW